MMKTWNQFKNNLPIVESVIPMNKQYGFLGTAGEKAGELLSKAVAHIKNANKDNKNFQMSDETIGHYLDSKGGRHLADLMTDKAPPEQIQKALKSSIGEFSKTYNPSLYESFADVGEENIQESDPHLTRVMAHALSTQGKFSAAKRREADKKARAEFLAKQAGTAPPSEKEEPKQASSEKKEVVFSSGISHSNPAKRAESHKALRKIMEKPLKAHEASEKIKKHFDDQRLHSDISHFAKTSPDTDVRPLVKKRMEQLRKQRGF